MTDRLTTPDLLSRVMAKISCSFLKQMEDRRQLSTPASPEVQVRSFAFSTRTICSYRVSSKRLWMPMQTSGLGGVFIRCSRSTRALGLLRVRPTFATQLAATISEANICVANLFFGLHQLQVLHSGGQFLKSCFPMPHHIRITADNYLTFSVPAFAPGFYISECLSLQRVHGANAYTAKEDPLLKATVQMSIARGLHESFPELTRLSNRLFANAVAAKWTARR